MDIQALKHMATVAQAIAGPRKIVVFGSASLFGTFPTADDQLEMLRRSQDADFILQPFDEATGRTLNDAIGGDAEFAAQFGYHADIVQPFATENFPPDFESRLVPLDGCANVFCLDPHDMAVAKLMVGRPKDIALLTDLARQQRLNLEKLATLLRQTPMTEAMIVKTHRVLDAVRTAAESAGAPQGADD